MGKDDTKELTGAEMCISVFTGCILVKSKRDFPKAYIKKLLKEAYVNSLSKVKDPCPEKIASYP